MELSSVKLLIRIMRGSLPSFSTSAIRVAAIGVDKDLGSILWAMRVLSPIIGGKLQPTHELHAFCYRGAGTWLGLVIWLTDLWEPLFYSSKCINRFGL